MKNLNHNELIKKLDHLEALRQDNASYADVYLAAKAVMDEAAKLARAEYEDIFGKAQG